MQVPAPFDYHRATSIDDALGLLAQLGEDARLVAGGHSLLPMMKLRLASPSHLVDINDLTDLAYIRREGDEIRVGAMTRHRDLLASALLTEYFPIVSDAERLIADPLVRNRGTIGGALCQADPSEDLSAVCAALDGRIVIRGPGGERIVDMVAFHHGPYETDAAQDEIVTEIRLPIRPAAGSAYEKVKRRVGDWAVAAAAASLALRDGRVEHAGVALVAVGASGVRSTAVEAALTGQVPSDELIDRAAALASADCKPHSDQRGPADYKRHLAGELTRRALRRAAERAGANL